MNRMAGQALTSGWVRSIAPILTTAMTNTTRRSEHFWCRRNTESGSGCPKSEMEKIMILRRPLLTLVLLGVVFTAAFLAAGDVNFARPTQEKPSPAPTISLDIVAADLRSKANEPNRVGPAARINVIAKNDSSEPVTVAVLNQYVQNRPQLFRSGKLVGYRQEIAKSLRARGDETEIVGLLRRDSIPLQPYSS